MVGTGLGGDKREGKEKVKNKHIRGLVGREQDHSMMEKGGGESLCTGYDF